MVSSGEAASYGSDSKQTIPGPVGHREEIEEAVALAASSFFPIMAQQKKDFEATITQQEKEIKSLTAGLREQAAQIQKVSARLEVSKPAPQVVSNQ